MYLPALASLAIYEALVALLQMRQCTIDEGHWPKVVFGSPVRSGFLTSRAFNRDHNQFFYFRKVKKTRLNQCGPVHINFLRLQDQLGLVKVQTG